MNALLTLPEIWNQYYNMGSVIWQSDGLGETSKQFLAKYSIGKRVLEIGCGNGADTKDFISQGYKYSGMDISGEAVAQAIKRQIVNAEFTVADIQTYKLYQPFNIVYDKGVFHNLPGPNTRAKFAQKVAGLLAREGTWISVCGSADNYNPRQPHGAVFLQHIITPIERYFEVLEVRKSLYGIQKPHPDFQAWHCAFRKR